MPQPLPCALWKASRNLCSWLACGRGGAALFVRDRFGGRERRLVIYELGNVEEGGNAIDAILGLDMLEGCRMELDWVRMEGTLEV